MAASRAHARLSTYRPRRSPLCDETRQTKFSEAAVGHFGSGWAWLVKKDGKLAVVGSHDAGNPLRDGSGFPILNCDVWEHAYYGAFCPVRLHMDRRRTFGTCEYTKC